MSPITHCPDCGHGLIPMLSKTGRTELACIWCERLDPPKTGAERRADDPRDEPTPVMATS